MIYCSYDEGMSANADYDAFSEVDEFFEFQAACFHEAGHAALGYFLGEGCSSVSVSATYRYDISGHPVSFAYGGMSKETLICIRQINSDMRIGRYNNNLAAAGVATAAGPASERKFRLINDMPLRLAGGSHGDRRRISVIAMSLRQTHRSPLAFERLIWRVAQRLLETAVIWESVDALAYTLVDRAELSPENQSFTLPGATARAVLNKAGCRPSEAERILRSIFAR